MSLRGALVAAAAVLLALAVGWWGRELYGPERAPSPAGTSARSGPCPDGAEPLYWKAPMDPTYVRDAPGKSPMGMDLVPECPAAGGAADDDAIRINPATVQNIGVRTKRVERRDLHRTIRALGRVTYDERLVAHVHTKVQGWTERLFVDYVGQQVRRGQPLLEIYSPELVATQEELLLASRYRDATGASPFEDVSQGGQALFDAAKQRMEFWDIPERDVQRLLDTGEIQKNLTLYAPSGGVVTELGVRHGMEVKPNQNLYTIADLSTVWVVAEVYEYELPWVALGQQGSVQLPYLPGEDFSGTVTYVSPFLDPKTRTAQVRLELPNPHGKLRPEMFGDILIQGTAVPDAIAIPSEAVIRSGQRTLVIVALGEGRFRAREIALGLDSGDGWLQVVRGLEPDEVVVASSQFLIDSESQLQEAVRKLLGGASAAETAESGSPPPEPEPAHDHAMPEPATEPEHSHEHHAMPEEP